MQILGVNAYHAGASACLIRDGILIAAAEEERFSRLKYQAGFPARSINYCLEAGGIEAYDLDHIGVSRDPNANLYRKVAFTLRHRPSIGLLRQRLAARSQSRSFREEFITALGLESHALRADFHSVEHHRAHMASAFFVSPFPRAALLSIDGVGDFVTTMYGRGDGNRIESLQSVYYPHSLGHFFTAVTQWLGFSNFGDEGKVQGLAAFGQPRFLDQLRKIVRLRPSGDFELDLSYLVNWSYGVEMSWPHGIPALSRMYSDRFETVFGPARAYGATITPRYADMAASLQLILEEAEFHLVNHLHALTGETAICLAGGVALNSTFNGKILPQTKFTDIFIQPAANDAGTALGVAYYVYHQVLGQPRAFVMRNAYTGPAIDNAATERALHGQGLDVEPADDIALAASAAELLAAGRVVGWCQGRMEWGPRALGNRSILADPRRAEMKDVLNARVKHRETFRPFAPSVLFERTGDYFDQTYPDPFMVKVYNVLAHRRAEIPSATHVDGTGRLQTVERSENPLYWELIRQFYERTGVPILLNTSFNENEPIVCRPEEAVACFLRTRMDALVVGNFLVRKRRSEQLTLTAATRARATVPARARVEFESLMPGDIPAVAALHQTLLTRRLTGATGRRLLELRYTNLLRGSGNGASCWVARLEGRIRGFAVVEWCPQKILSVIPGYYPFRLAAVLAAHAWREPASARDLARFFWDRRPMRTILARSESPGRWCFLRSLAAEPGVPGTGSFLVQHAVRQARVRKFEQMITGAWAANEELLRANGFSRATQAETESRHGNVVWLRRPLSDRSAAV